MPSTNIYAGSQEPNPGGLIYADQIKALMRGQRDPHSTTTVAPVVIDDFIHVPLIISDDTLKVRHRLLKLTSYDEASGAWFAGLPDDDDIDSQDSLRSVFVVYQEFDYGILIGDKPVRVKVAASADIHIADNLGGDHASSNTGLDRIGLLAVTQAIQDDVDDSWYCLCVRGAFDSRMVQATFIEYETPQDETDGIALCEVVETTVTGLIGQQIKVKDRDGAGFANETEAELVGRLLGAVWMQYKEGNYYFWRWSLWKISCPDDV